MFFVGKIVGFLLGLAALGPVGALLGGLAGHFFDRGLARNILRLNPRQMAEVQGVFFETVFLMLGYLAKADGRVSETEITHTEQYMRQMGLAAAHRREAIALFARGRDGDFDAQQVLAQFQRVCARYGNLRQLLLVYLLGVALADDHLDQAEDHILRQVASVLGFNSATYESLLRMVSAQNQFAGFAGGRAHRRGRAPQPPRRDQLATAYQALGTAPDASDAEIKRAYRKLISQYHPDKLIGQGVPEDMVQVATERAQEVQTAYDLIKKSRGR